MSARDDAIEAIRRRALHTQDANLLDETCESILDAVEPIIRADERERMLAEGWTEPGHQEDTRGWGRSTSENRAAAPVPLAVAGYFDAKERADIEAEVRERIAQSIEALVLDPKDHCIEEYNAGLTNAARTARSDDAEA